MTYDGDGDDDDLFDEEFDFVDEEDDDSEDDDGEDDDSSAEDPSEDGPSEDDEVEEKKPVAKKKSRPTKAKSGSKRKPKATDSDVVADESSAEASTKETSAGTSTEETEEKTETEPEEIPEPPSPPTDHVVHLYEFGDFTRTLPREFTSEDAEAFAIEYNRTSNPHSRQAVAAGKDEEHALSVSQIPKTASG